MSRDRDLDDDDDRPRSDDRGRDDDDDRPRRKKRTSSGSSDGGGKTLLILFGIGFVCVLGCCGVCGGFMWLGSNEMKDGNKAQGDAMFANEMHNGNTDAIYANADPEFKTAYTLNEFNAFVASNPTAFKRDNLYSGLIRERYAKDEYTTIDSKTGLFDGGMRIYFRKGKDGKKRLAGVAPGLDKLIPSSIKHDPNNPNYD